MSKRFNQMGENSESIQANNSNIHSENQCIPLDSGIGLNSSYNSVFSPIKELYFFRKN